MERLYPITEEVRFQYATRPGMPPVAQSKDIPKWTIILYALSAIVVAGAITYHHFKAQRENKLKNEITQTF